MQNGSITRSKRLKGPDVWEFRWRESGPDGKRKQRRMVVGSIRQFADESAALRTITALRRDINLGNARLRAKPITVSELVDHYRQRELEPDTAWKTHSTKVTYQGYLNKWILPRWGAYPLIHHAQSDTSHRVSDRNKQAHWMAHVFDLAPGC